MEYDFGKCVERSVMISAGCQSPWSRIVLEGLPMCDNDTLLVNYNIAYFKAMGLRSDELIEYTGCLMPCTFMEYQVQFDMLLARIIQYLFRRRGY